MDLGSLPGICVSASFPLQGRVTLAWGRIGSQTEQAETGMNSFWERGSLWGASPFQGWLQSWGQAKGSPA